MNTGVRQGCSLSPLLFIIYTNKIIQKWRLPRHGYIPISTNVNTNTILFADDHILLTKSEDDSVHSLNNTVKEFSMEINI
jgi:hypothetical protein